MTEAQERELRPWIIAETIAEIVPRPRAENLHEKRTSIRIRNTGKWAALMLKVECNRDLFAERLTHELVERSYEVFAPNRVEEISYYPTFNTKGYITITVKYQWYGNPVGHSEMFDLNLLKA